MIPAKVLAALLLAVPLRVLAQPANDDCPAAQPLALNSPVDCPFNGVAGTTLGATQDGAAPLCDPDGVFLDVWYVVDLGPDTVLNLFLQPSPQMTDYGIELLDACGGSSIDCGFAPQVLYSIEVQPFTTYIVRVSTNTDFGDPGPFVLCASVPDPIPDCDGAVVKTTTGEVTVSTCIDGLPDPVGFDQFSTSPAAYAFLLCTAGDTLVQVLSGDTLDADTLPMGTHHVWGISYQGDLVDDVAGTPVTDISATGTCWELSAGPVSITADICSGIVPREGPDGFEVRSPDGPGLPIWVRTERSLGSAEVRLLDTHGRSVTLYRGPLSAGTWSPIPRPLHQAAGMYVVQVIAGSVVRGLPLFLL